jgi:hypothetical protein
MLDETVQNFESDDESHEIVQFPQPCSSASSSDILDNVGSGGSILNTARYCF